jgi:hypothetical protein
MPSFTIPSVEALGAMTEEQLAELVSSINTEASGAADEVRGEYDSVANEVAFTGTVTFDSAQIQRISNPDASAIWILTDNGGPGISIQTGSEQQIIPVDFGQSPTTNTINIGSETTRFKDGYFRGKLFSDSVMADEGIEFAGTLSDGTIKITQFDDDGTLFANSSTRVPTQAAVKAYVDNNSGPTITQSLGSSQTLVPSQQLLTNSVRFTISGETGADAALNGTYVLGVAAVGTAGSKTVEVVASKI